MTDTVKHDQSLPRSQPQSLPRSLPRWREGLWDRNPALVMLLGLCPLLAVSNSLVNGTALALATLITLCVSNTLVAALRKHLISTVRIPMLSLMHFVWESDSA